MTPRFKESRLRHRRFGRNGRGARGGGHHADSPGLLVIIDAIKESRDIFQRMNRYGIHRIAETLRVLFFMTMALLDDGAILSIAYGNVRYKNKPEAWNMRMVLGASTVIGVIGVISAFDLFI